MADINKDYIKDMVDWAKEVAEWQIANPTKDWATELFGATSSVDEDAGPGSNPLPPPPPPPPHG